MQMSSSLFFRISLCLMRKRKQISKDGDDDDDDDASNGWESKTFWTAVKPHTIKNIYAD